MNIQDVSIEKLLVHKPPMRLIDRATAVIENGVECEVDISPDNIFMTEQGVPAYVAVEFMAQTIGAYDGWDRYQRKDEPRIGYLVGTRQLKLNCDFFTVGQTLKVDAVMIWDGENLLQFRCTARDKSTNAELASATINVYSPHRSSSDEMLEGRV